MRRRLVSSSRPARRRSRSGSRAKTATLLQIVGFYRIIAYRPLVDLALFVFLLGLLVLATAPFGPTAA